MTKPRGKTYVFLTKPRGMQYTLYAFFTPKNPSTLHRYRHLIEHKCFTAERFAIQTFQQPVSDPSQLYTAQKEI